MRLEADGARNCKTLWTVAFLTHWTIEMDHGNDASWSEAVGLSFRSSRNTAMRLGEANLGLQCARLEADGARNCKTLWSVVILTHETLEKGHGNYASWTETVCMSSRSSRNAAMLLGDANLGLLCVGLELSLIHI